MQINIYIIEDCVHYAPEVNARVAEEILEEYSTDTVPVLHPGDD